VENNRLLLRVTNNGISARISPNGSVQDSTAPFASTVRTWTIGGKRIGTTFYTRYGDVFVYACALINLGIVSATFMTRRKGYARLRRAP
jgi:apolipoprotein N-acyltransferase